MTRGPLVPRNMSPLHPKANLPCLHCGKRDGGAHGPSCVSGYTFTAAEIASALIQVGKGGSYGEVSADIRREAMRNRQPARRKPKTKAKKLRPRSLLPPKAAAKKRPSGQLPRKKYDYAAARPKASLTIQPSRSGNLAQGYVDVFAPVIFEAFPVAEWPSIVIIDSLPIKRRRIDFSKRTGKVGKISAGDRQGEIYAAADGTTTPGTPILAGLEGSKDATSVKRFLDRLPTVTEPVWVVADIDDGIRLAVEQKWPNAILYRCEEHLKMLCRSALEKDGISEWVPFDHPDAAPRNTKGAKVSSDRFIEHRLFHALHSAMWTERRWKAFAALVDQLVRPEKGDARKWIADNTATVVRQVGLRKQHKGFPRSTGAIEGTIRAIKHIVSNRAEYYRNGERLDKLVNLIRLDKSGVADLDIYASLITKHLMARKGAGVDWRSGRDLFGTASIDDRIINALNEHAPIAAQRVLQQLEVRRDAETVKVNAWLASQGRPPIARARHAYATHPIYQLPRAGLTIADYPDLLAQYDPARNDGVPADRRPAASNKLVEWVCTEHRTPSGGHDHVWEEQIERRTNGSGCRVCAGKEVCEASSLRYLRPELADEWFQPRNGALTIDNVSPAMGHEVYWWCRKDGHEPFLRRISTRSAEKHGCRACKDATNREGARETRNRTAVAQRARVTAQKPITVPPVLDSASRKLPAVPVGNTMPPHAVAVAIRRTEQTIRNWIRADRIAAYPPASKGRPFLIPESEVHRVREILGVPDDPDLEAA
jgi:hypothetical protein